jgi:hypothetical protein
MSYVFLPGGLLPLHVAVLPYAELLHLAEEGVGGDGGVRPVLLPQDELHPLSRRGCCTKKGAVGYQKMVFFRFPLGLGLRICIC